MVRITRELSGRAESIDPGRGGAERTQMPALRLGLRRRPPLDPKFEGGRLGTGPSSDERAFVMGDGTIAVEMTAGWTESLEIFDIFDTSMMIRPQKACPGRTAAEHPLASRLLLSCMRSSIAAGLKSLSPSISILKGRADRKNDPSGPRAKPLLTQTVSAAGMDEPIVDSGIGMAFIISSHLSFVSFARSSIS